MPERPLKSRSCFADLARPAATNAGQPGLVVTDRDGLRLALVKGRAAQTEALRARLRATYGLDPPLGPGRILAGGVSLIGTGPNAWLATSETGGVNFAADLALAVGDTGSVTDQSDGYAALRLAGPAVAEVLAKGVPIDLHPRAFGPTASAVTLVARIPIVLWSVVGPGEQGLAVEIATPRSSFGSFWSWLSASAAAFGIVVRPSSQGVD